LRRADVVRPAWVLTLALVACSSPHTAPNLPVKGDHRYHAYAAVEARDRALNSRDLLSALARYAPDAEVLDIDNGDVLLRGRDAIQADLDNLLARCADLRIDVAKRQYSERGRFVSDLERVHCSGTPPVQEWVKYEVADSRIVRVWRPRAPAQR
jgi:hypothetical protein